MPPKRANSSTESLHTSKHLASDITDEQEPQIIPKTANKMGLLCRENRRTSSVLNRTLIDYSLLVDFG
ncbi:unnamed protein product [Rhizophagus irregularis]|uniref:Uncharacterized protein n=1 Tax=Rhizophagus irregularis TaxID=588596 RepID=A0A915YZ94_9GLOM|nr:unnamed protein product [Rhizophagus irregularis]CAB4488601.1 unnamed protein product [Rhizophagus irregularis]CAB5216527.1 unnamed protein product [Rhizophagus irregularis]CAB5353425.1 unnamed protein product [Rhizophagus irregularis]CAB5392787.1 unnamed protein product [Rhizophagus irregularis]